MIENNEVHNNQDNVKQTNQTDNGIFSKFLMLNKILNPMDKSEVIQDLQKIMLKSAFIGYGLFAVGFMFPTFYKNYITSSASNLSINKFQLSKNPNRTRIINPFFSFAIGFFSLIISNRISSKYFYNQKVSSLENNYSKHNQYLFWKQIDHKKMGLYLLHYLRIENSNKILTNKSLEQAQSKNKIDSQFSEIDSRIDQGFNSDPNSDYFNNKNDNYSKWDSIRSANLNNDINDDSSNIFSNEENYHELLPLNFENQDLSFPDIKRV